MKKCFLLIACATGLFSLNAQEALNLDQNLLAMLSSEQAVQELLKHGFDVNRVDEDGNTLVMLLVKDLDRILVPGILRLERKAQFNFKALLAVAGLVGVAYGIGTRKTSRDFLETFITSLVVGAVTLIPLSLGRCVWTQALRRGSRGQILSPLKAAYPSCYFDSVQDFIANREQIVLAMLTHPEANLDYTNGDGESVRDMIAKMREQLLSVNGQMLTKCGRDLQIMLLHLQDWFVLSGKGL